MKRGRGFLFLSSGRERERGEKEGERMEKQKRGREAETGRGIFCFSILKLIHWFFRALFNAERETEGEREIVLQREREKQGKHVSFFGNKRGELKKTFFPFHFLTLLFTVTRINARGRGPHTNTYYFEENKERKGENPKSPAGRTNSDSRLFLRLRHRASDGPDDRPPRLLHATQQPQSERRLECHETRHDGRGGLVPGVEVSRRERHVEAEEEIKRSAESCAGEQEADAGSVVASVAPGVGEQQDPLGAEHRADAGAEEEVV